MSSSPRFKIYDADGYYVASAKDAYLAAAIVALIGEGGMIRDGHRFTVWEEGSEEQPASESYDFTAGLIDLRVSERGRLNSLCDPREPRKPEETRSIPPPPVPPPTPPGWEPVKSIPERPPEPPEQEPSAQHLRLAADIKTQLDRPGAPLAAGLYTGGITSAPLTSDSFRLITRVMRINNWVRVTFTPRWSQNAHTIEGNVVNIGPRFSSFRLHTATGRYRGLDIGPATHNVFTVEILNE